MSPSSTTAKVAAIPATSIVASPCSPSWGRFCLCSIDIFSASYSQRASVDFLPAAARWTYFLQPVNYRRSVRRRTSCRKSWLSLMPSEVHAMLRVMLECRVTASIPAFSRHQRSVARCVLVPALFNMVFCAMFSGSFQEIGAGFRYRTDGSLFNLQRRLA